MNKMYSLFVKPVILAFGIVCVLAFTQWPAFAEATEEQQLTEERIQEQSQTRWDEQAEKTFGMAKGQGLKLMTQNEWREHQRKMQDMTAEEKERYRSEVHERMVERAKEKGIYLSDTPGPHGSDKTGTRGRGKGGMGGGGRGR